MKRADMIARLEERREPWDMLVIGGGATGMGIAVDAASRGYAVLLLEQHDFGKGTSSRSTKLVHGGVRYLEQGNITPARQFFRRAAEAGLAQAAIRLATTYDPAELRRFKAQGLVPDLAEARKWYERARELGADEAEERLSRLGSGS